MLLCAQAPQHSQKTDAVTPPRAERDTGCSERPKKGPPSCTLSFQLPKSAAPHCGTCSLQTHLQFLCSCSSASRLRRAEPRKQRCHSRVMGVWMAQDHSYQSEPRGDLLWITERRGADSPGSTDPQGHKTQQAPGTAEDLQLLQSSSHHDLFPRYAITSQ